MVRVSPEIVVVLRMDYKVFARGQEQPAPADTKPEHQGYDLRAVLPSRSDGSGPPQLASPQKCESTPKKTLPASDLPGSEYWLP